MRSTTVNIVVQCQPTAWAPDVANKHSSRKRTALLVMVLGALLQFIKRVCILVLGLLRLSYRKVRDGKRETVSVCVDVLSGANYACTWLSRYVIVLAWAKILRCVISNLYSLCIGLYSI